MTRPQLMIIAASLAVSSFAFSAPASAALAASNPLAKASTLPFNYPVFDKIRIEHFAPAFAEGMRREAAEVNAIANHRKPATFENTIVAMERSGTLLDRVSGAFSILGAGNSNDAIKALELTLAPKAAAHRDAISLNQKLFERIETLYAKRDKLGLDAEAAFLLERYHKDFIRAGARLNAADKRKLKAYNAELATLQATFSQNVQGEAKAAALVVDSRAELDGMPEAAIDAAAANASQNGLEGKFMLAVTNTTGQAAMAVLTNRAVRQRLQEASMGRGSHGGKFDNTGVVLRLATLRAERAALLGYPNHAAYVLDDQTAKDTGSVNKLLAELVKPAVANARKEAADIQAMIDAGKGGFQLAAHDWAFYSDKVRAQRFNFDQSQLRPYFELNNVLTKGVFYAAGQLYGLTFKERKDLPVYDPDMRVFDVIDADGKPLAIFVADLYARANKRGGAWANAYVPQSHLMGTRPVIGNHLNIPKPAAGEPTLLTYDELRTLFHEFGHALHSMFSDVSYPRFAGTAVPRDYVEFPSQVNEMWSLWPEVLGNYAKHYKTGEPMPKELLDKVIGSKQFNEGYRTTENLASSILDQRWHQLDAVHIPTDVLAFEAAAMKDAGVDFAPVPPRYRSTYFSHVFSGGYSAGYYGYLWSEKLDADTVEWFKENGGLSRKNGDHFRKTLLSKGGTLDAMQMYRNFRGRDATIEPLLERRGLNAR
ncbi:M3 family metallopeptidase [Massilia sp. DJPM01]|uniref:M3 family metallopeptidase n=1 Tax=Massilia sp. DJPM01 TaxID=3024404 RepID=UPI00259F298D|nr:M3 family metallopeptidase [Massilia sp. DJPM01]MDM5177889.1 M3 family metallopeptidase [Massilia sp. DJPM01]